MARSSSVPAILFLVCIASVLAVGGFILFKDTEGPIIEISPNAERVSPGQKFTVTASDKGSGVKSITVLVRKGARTLILARQDFPESALEQKLDIALKDLGFREGAFELEIRAVDGSFAGFGRGNGATRLYNMRLDSSPPRVNVKTLPPYVRRGGSSVIIFSVNKEVGKAGVRVGELFFPAYKLAEGSDYLCFFAFPYYMEPAQFQPELVALDLAGNETRNKLQVFRINRRFRNDPIPVTDNFLQAKMDEFLKMVPGDMNDIDRFNRVNGEVRRQNQEKLVDLSTRTASEFLWAKTFTPLAGANRANFGDHRRYMYKGEQLAVEATHLGLDLASTAMAPVPAANNGVVVFADYLGIYGNLVVIDHGLGLQSLYSHLSSIDVTVGQKLNRGDILGRTGATGMAAGDHLHFGVTVGGLEVTPIEWLDTHWIRDNVVDRIQQAGIDAPELEAPPARRKAGARRR